LLICERCDVAEATLPTNRLQPSAAGEIMGRRG
jgi:hypothetical protein